MNEQNYKFTFATFILCGIILIASMFPLHYWAYTVLKLILSTGLYILSHNYLLPCRKIIFFREDGMVEKGTIDYNQESDDMSHAFSGSLYNSARDPIPAAKLDVENSEIIKYLICKCEFLGFRRPPLPHISLPINFGMILGGIIMNPVFKIELPRTTWIFLDILILILLGYGWHKLSSQFSEEQPYTELKSGPFKKPYFPLFTQSDLINMIVSIKQLVIYVVGAAFIMTIVGISNSGSVKDKNIVLLAGGTLYSLIMTLFMFFIICWPIDGRQRPALLLVFVLSIVMLLLSSNGMITLGSIKDHWNRTGSSSQ
jgi:hypothetical protein